MTYGHAPVAKLHAAPFLQSLPPELGAPHGWHSFSVSLHTCVGPGQVVAVVQLQPVNETATQAAGSLAHFPVGGPTNGH